MEIIEVSLNTNLKQVKDALAENIAKQAYDYYNIKIEEPKIIRIYTIDIDLKKEETGIIVKNIFDKITRKVSVNTPLAKDFDHAIWWGLKPGVKDNEGEVAKEAIEFVIGKKKEGNVYVSTLLTFRGDFEEKDLKRIASLITNQNVEMWEIISKMNWNSEKGVGPRISKVEIDKEPSFRFINFNITDSEFSELNKKNNWALSLQDFQYIKDHFYNNSDFSKMREKVGIKKDLTDVEIECLAQVLSDHCSHRTFRGKFYYTDEKTKEKEVFDDLFKNFIKNPTEKLAKKKNWIVSVLEDNAGAMFLDKDGDYIFAVKGETHNSPSNKEPYGGAYTGIAGIFRDIMGFGRGAKVIMGMYGFVVPPLDFKKLEAEIPPSQLLNGIIHGVRDGGNKHGIPTCFGNIFFHDSFISKALVYVTTGGISKRIVAGQSIEKKKAEPGDLLVIYGGRTGIDGIHGVTEASMGFSKQITMGHVQKGDSYLQRKVSELLEQATLKDLIKLSWDLGGGGLSSAITETARFSWGVKVDLKNVLTKYKGMELWQTWVSESQERMLAAVSKEKIKEFQELAKLHDVELSIMGEFTDSGFVHIQYNDKTCGYLPLDLLHKNPPQWEFDASWIPPEFRLQEPILSELENEGAFLKRVLERPNICSKEWVARQYDHEVKGGSVIKHMIGKNMDVHSPAAVLRPVLEKKEGIAMSQIMNPIQSKIDTYWMTMNVIDEALRRICAVGGVKFNKGEIERVGLVDNFCWPEIRYSKTNPDGKYKAAQLVRSLQALAEFEEKFELPFLSGKDSMYIDGWVNGKSGERQRISGLPCLQITAVGSVDDIEKCTSMDFKSSGDLIYIVGKTKNELGASEFYEMLDYTGLNIPKVDIEVLKRNMLAISRLIEEERITSALPITRGGLITDLSKMSFAGELGAEIDLKKVPVEGIDKNYQIMYSESASRFIVTVNPRDKEDFEKVLKEDECDFACIGEVKDDFSLIVKGLDGKEVIKESIAELKKSYKKTFGGLI